MSGETVVGSIKGFLTLDADQYHREIERAIAEADTLDGKRVDVKIKADGADRAASSMRSASSSMDGVTQASRRVEDATSRVNVTQLRLNELRDSGRAKASQVANAENALARARRAEQDAIFATYEGNLRLSKSQDEVSRTARIVARDVESMGGSFGGLQSPQVIVGGIVAAMALLGPVTGAATAAMGGFVGVAGTGALAFRGFQQEVQKGTALGQYLQASLAGIKTEFDSLGSTAAHAMEGDVLSGLSTIRRFLPTLNPEVESLAGHLGRALNTSATGVVSGLQNMMPLLEDGGRYAEILANKFAEFTASGEFKEFVAYAQRELPGVGQAIISLSMGVKDLAVSLAPAGDSLVKIIDATGKVASGFSHVIDAVTWLRNSKLGQLGMAPELNKTADSANNATSAIQEHTSHLLTLQAAQSPLAAAIGVTDAALGRAASAQRSHQQAAMDATASMYQEGNAAGLLQQELDKLNGKALGVASAQNAFDSALANSNKHLNAAGKQIDRATTSLSGNSAAAVANRGELIRQVQAAEGVAVAMRDNGKSTEETRAKMVKMRDEIVKNAHDHGLNADAVQKFIDKIYKIPKSVPPTKLEVETKAAMSGIAAFQKAIDQLHGKTVTASVRYAYTGTLPNGGHSTGGGSTFGESAGGVVRYFANGGTENHVAQIAPAGSMRVWAEPETGGEAYIPLAPSKRARSTQVLAEANQRMGNPLGHGSTVALDDATIARLVAAMSRVQVNSIITAGSVNATAGRP